MPCRIRTVDRGLTKGDAVPVPINATVPRRRGATSQPDRQLQVPLGYVVLTRAVAHRLMCHDGGRAFVMSCLYRHACGDWGDLGSHDAEANDLALTTGGRILSSYLIPEEIRQSAGHAETGAAPSPDNGSDSDPRVAIADERLWIITEAEDGRGLRSQTTLLFPSDY